MEKTLLLKGTTKYKAVVARLQANTATLAQVQEHFYLTHDAVKELKGIAARAAIADFYKNTTPSHPYKTNTYMVAGYNK